MDYQIYLCRFDDPDNATWSGFENLYTAQSENTRPDPAVLAALRNANDAIRALSIGDHEFDISYDNECLIQITFDHRPETALLLPKFAEIINAVADDLGPQWFIADDHAEVVSKHLDIEALTEEANFLTEPPRKPSKKQVIQWTLTVLIAGLIGWGLGGTDNNGTCEPFEVPGTEPGTCSVPCLANETQEACDKRAQQLWQDAGINAEPIAD